MLDDHDPAVTGRALAGEYFRRVVRPLLAQRCPDARLAAARVGTGSDVLGLDDATSRDHDWGLRLQLLVAEGDVPRIGAALEAGLPDSFRGLPVRFAFSGRPEARLGVDVTTPARFARDRLGFDPVAGVTTQQWLSVSGQAALEVVAGEVYQDRVGGLTRLRDALAWYPDDVWRYVVACDWQRLDQGLPLMARAADRGDETGSRIIAARLADVVVHLAFLLSRTWAPYPKWRGTAFSRLPIAPRLAGHLQAALAAGSGPERGEALRLALGQLGRVQAGLGLPTPDPVVVPFWDRPHLRVEPSLVPALMDSVTDPAVRGLLVGVGGIDQVTDNVDLLVRPERRLDVVAGAHGLRREEPPVTGFHAT